MFSQNEIKLVYSHKEKRGGRKRVKKPTGSRTRRRVDTKRTEVRRKRSTRSRSSRGMLIGKTMNRMEQK